MAAADWRGRLTPLHCTANGKVLLAFGSGGVPAELRRLTPRTITASDLLRAELGRVRELGHARTVEELEIGLNAVAAPVFGPSGEAVAAVSIAGPAYRLPESGLDALGQSCVATADEVSTRLGYRRAA